MQTYYVYILASLSKVLYTGVTNSLHRRLWEHKNKVNKGFTARYHVTRLVYYEVFHDIHEAIAREKEIKKWNRTRKIALIESMNATWKDLSAGWYK